MKTTLIIRNVIIVCLAICLGCSKDSIDEEEEAVTRCFVVKDINTNIPISNAEITAKHFSCSGGGCGFSTIGVKLTNQNGEACFNLGNFDPGDISVLYCKKDAYKPFEMWHFPLDFREIYLEPN